MKYSNHNILLFFTIILSFVNSTFSQTENIEGIELFKKDDYQGAVKVLKKSNDTKDLYYLGLSYEKMNETEKARNAFKKSFEESYRNFFKSFNKWREVGRENQKQSFLNLLQELNPNNQIGLSAAEKAFSLKSSIFQTNEWRIKAKVLSDAINLAKTQDDIYYSSDPSISTLKITDKKRADYPKSNQGIPLTRFNKSPNKPIIVRLFIVFRGDGEIKLMMPVDESIDIFTAESLSAASQIKFNPATKENKVVSSHLIVEYSFDSR